MRKISDEKLVSLTKKGDKHAEFLLFNRYYHLSQTEAKKFYHSTLYKDLEIEEYFSICFSSVAVAIKKYKKLDTFYNYWKTICRNNMVNAARSIRPEHYNVVSFDSILYEDNDSLSFHDSLGTEDGDYVYGDIIKMIENYIYDINNDLDDDEALVAHLLVYRQYTYEEIAKVTKWKMTKVYYVAHCVREKISDYLKKRIFK
mgnify:CR=1 FL=1